MMDRVWAILVMLLIAIGCRAGEDEVPEAKDTNLHLNLDALAKRLELRLPAGTQVVHVETESGMDDAVFAKLRIPVAHAEEFIQSLHLTRYYGGAADLFGPDRGAWDPHRVKKLRVGDVLLPSTRGLVVGLDESSSDVLVVYVMNHGT